jgi:hypothetical protein
MATAMFAEMLDNFQHSMRHSPEIWCCINSSRENIRTKIKHFNWKT